MKSLSIVRSVLLAGGICRSMKRYAFLPLVLFVQFAFPAHAEIVTLYSAQDAEIMQNGTSGTVNGMNWGTTQYMTTNWNGPSGTPNSTLFPNTANSFGLVRFDLSSIPAGSILNSAILTLYAHSANPNTGSISLYQITSDWSEGTVTYNTRPTQGSVVATLAPTYGPFTFNLTGIAQDWFDGDASNYGVITSDVHQRSQSGGRYYYRFYSKEAAGTQFDPLLTINYTPPVPEPETYAMLLAGLLVIGVIARRRNQHV
jgi:hypothetical protein